MQHSTKIIAIAGFKNSGKDECALMLQFLLNSPKCFHKYFIYKNFKNWFKNPYRIVSFAYPLKKVIASLLNLNVVKFNNRDFKENTYVYFPTLEITTNPSRTLNDYKFNKYLLINDFSFINEYYLSIRQCMQFIGTEVCRQYIHNDIWINATLKSQKPFIISDLRFCNEYEAIKKQKGIVFYIDRPGIIAGNHASEKEVETLLENDKFDIVVNNNSDLKSLFNQLNKLIEYV